MPNGDYLQGVPDSDGTSPARVPNTPGRIGCAQTPRKYTSHIKLGRHRPTRSSYTSPLPAGPRQRREWPHDPASRVSKVWVILRGDPKTSCFANGMMYCVWWARLRATALAGHPWGGGATARGDAVGATTVGHGGVTQHGEGVGHAAPRPADCSARAAQHSR